MMVTDEDTPARAAIRRQWHYLIIFSLIVAVTIGVISGLIFHEHRDNQNQIERIEQNRRSSAETTLRGCQRGNELRRAVAQIKSDQTARTGEFSSEVQNTEIDPDAVLIDNCREAVKKVTGVMLPEGTSNFVD